MSAIKTAIRLLKTPEKLIAPLGRRGFLDWMSDEKYLKLRYKAELGKNLNLKNPQTFNEKLQWLKLHDRNPMYCTMVDKYAVKQYVADKIGGEYIIPTLGIWERYSDIDISQLPEQFVLKCTHDSGSVYICKDKKTFDSSKAEKILTKGLKNKPTRYGREWPYAFVQPRILAEKYMVDESETELKDYKIFTFSGKAALVQVDFGRFSNHRRNIYTLDWQLMNATIKYPNDPQVIIPKPQNLELMIELAEKLAEGIPHVRVDFYSIREKLYFGELTFYHGAGFEKIHPQELENWMGELLKLPISDSI